MSNTITGWLPILDSSGNFKEETGWDVILKDIFIVLVTIPGSRCWQPEFGCELLNRLFSTENDQELFNTDIRNAFRWLPHIKLINVQSEIRPMENNTNRTALHILIDVEWNNETANIPIILPNKIDLLRGKIYDINMQETDESLKWV